MVANCRSTKDQPSRRRQESFCERFVRGIQILDDRMIGSLNKVKIEEDLMDPLVEVLKGVRAELDKIESELNGLNSYLNRSSASHINLETQTLTLMLKQNQLRKEMEVLQGFHHRLKGRWRQLAGFGKSAS